MFLVKNINRFLISLVFVVVLFGGQPLGGVMAVVGDEIITQGDFFQQLSLAAEQKRINPSLTPKKYELLADQILSNMIDQYVLLDFAIKDSTVFVSDSEVKQQVEQQISFFIERVGSQKELEKIFNMPLLKIKEYYWEEVYHSMLIDRFKYSLLSGVSIGKKEVEDFYSTNKDSLPDIPATASFSSLNLSFVPSETTIDSIFSLCLFFKENIDGGREVFDSLIINHSDDFSSLESFGVVGYTARGTLFPEYEELAFSSKVGAVVGPVKTDAGFHIIKIIDKKGEKVNTQHLLKAVVPTESDKKETIEKINSLYEKSSEDLYFLESYVEGLDSSPSSFSGNYSNIPIENLPDEISAKIRERGAPFLFYPYLLSNGSILLLSLYDKKPPSKPSIENSFDYISSLAKEQKAKKALDDWLIRSKKNVYINIFEQ